MTQITPTFGERERQRLIRLFAVLGSDNVHERTAATDKIGDLLAQYGKTWTDIPALLALGTAVGIIINPDITRHVSALGSRNASHREASRQWLLDLLIRCRRTWNDLVDMLCSPTSWADMGDPSPPPGFDDGQKYAVIDLVHRITEYYIALTPTQRVAVTLWILHAHVYDRFEVTPRLVLVSPVRGCGKTVLLSLIETLVPKPEKSDAITPAAIYHLIDAKHPTLLIDEVDNIGLGFASNGRLRAIFNSGHRKGGGVTLLHRGQPHRFSTHATLGLAAIGRLPLPQMHRSIVIEMERYDGAGELQRFSGADAAIDYVSGRLRFWQREVTLAADPAMPPQLRNRQADNWRPLIAIADAFGGEWPRLARDAAVAFASAQQDEDAGVLLLHDIRTIFDAHGVERMTSVALVAALNDIDDGLWCEWRGPHGNQQPRRLSPGELARLLAQFNIRPRTIWPQPRTAETRSAKGYHRSQFEQAWHSYCDGDAGDGTASRSNTVRRLRSV